MHLFTSLLIIFEGFSILIISYTVTLSQDLLHTRKLSEMWSFCLLKAFAVHLPSTSRQKRYVSKKKRKKKKKRKQKKRKKKFNKKVRKQQLRDFRAMASTCACAELYHSGQSCLQSLCYFCPAEDRDLWERDWSSESHTAYSRDFTFMSASQFASVNRNRRLVAVFIDQFTVSTFRYLFMLTLEPDRLHIFKSCQLSYIQ